MNARTLALATTVCGIAALATYTLATLPAAPERAAVQSHGTFAARLQPMLEGIGSTRELTPVPLGEADQPESSPSGEEITRTGRHEPRSRQR